MSEDFNGRSRRITKKGNRLMKALVVTTALIFMLSTVPIVESLKTDVQPSAFAKLSADYKGLVKSALGQLKGTQNSFGRSNLDKGFMDWIDNWDGQTLPEEKDITVDTASGNVQIKDGNLVSDGQSSSLDTATKPDNVLIIVGSIGPVKKGQKDWAGITLPPKDKSDTIVVGIDKKDIRGSLLKMKLVLYHELIHVNQFRAEDFDGDVKDNWEVEAHARTIPLLIELYKQHPDEKNRTEIEKLYGTVIKNLRRYAKSCNNKTRALRALVDVKKWIKNELYSEMKELGDIIADLKKEIKEIKEKLAWMEAAGLLQGIQGLTDSIKAELQALEKKLDELMKELEELKKKNAKLLEDLEKLIDKLEELKGNNRRIEELEWQRKHIPHGEEDPTGYRKDKQDEIKRLKEKNRELKKEILSLYRSVSKAIDEELKEIKAIKKKKDNKKDGIQTEISKLKKKFANLFFILWPFFPFDPPLPPYIELLIELFHIEGKLGKISDALKVMDFKLKALGDIEGIIKSTAKQGIGKNF